MRHRKRSVKFGLSGAHRRAMLATLVCNLIERKRIKTTLRKAREASRLADKAVTLGRKNVLSARRDAVAMLRNRGAVTSLFKEIVPQFDGRAGGYTRIIKLGRRHGDGAETVFLEWVGIAPPERKKKAKKEEEKKA